MTAPSCRHGIRFAKVFCTRFLAVFTLVLTAFTAFPANAGVTIKERTKTYRVSGNTAAELARSMSRRGPYSRAHRARSWATATRDLQFQIKRVRRNGQCHVKDADISMTITYTLPRLNRKTRLNARHRTRWQSMVKLLTKHERVHGRFYRELAMKTHRSLLHLHPAKSCRALDRNALKLVKRLSAEDSRRNQRFDRRDKTNYRRMNRLFSGG